MADYGWGAVGGRDARRGLYCSKTGSVAGDGLLGGVGSCGRCRGVGLFAALLEHAVGVKVLGVVRVWVRLEAAPDDGRRGADSDRFFFQHVVDDRDLGGHLAVDRVHARVHVLDVVLVHHFAVDDAHVLGLLGEARGQEEHLGREQKLQHESLEDGHARAVVESGQREEHHVDEGVAGAEEAEDAQGGRIRIPDGHFPYVARLVGVSARFGGFAFCKVLDVSKGRGGGRRRIDSDAVRGGCRRALSLDVRFE